MGDELALKPRSKKRPDNGEIQAHWGWSIWWRDVGGVGVTPAATDDLILFLNPSLPSHRGLSCSYLIVHMKHTRCFPLLSGLCLLFLFVSVSACLFRGRFFLNA